MFSLKTIRLERHVQRNLLPTKLITWRFQPISACVLYGLLE